MRIVVVPNQVRDAINKAIDEKLDGRPISAEEREDVYNALLAYFDDHGCIPDFDLRAK
jgi:hypothetical protein